MWSKAFLITLRHCGKGELKWIAARERLTAGFFAACSNAKCPKMYPFTWVFSIALFWLSEVKAVGTFYALTLISFLFPVICRSSCIAGTSRGTDLDRCSLGQFYRYISLGVWQSASGYKVSIAYSFCIFKYINRFWFLLFSLAWIAYSVLGEIEVNPSGQGRIIWQCSVLVCCIFFPKPSHSMQV